MRVERIVLLLCLAVGALQPAAAAPLRYEAAQVAVTEPGSFLPPAIALDEAQLPRPGQWRETPLPYVAGRSLGVGDGDEAGGAEAVGESGQAGQAGRVGHADDIITSWLRIRPAAAQASVAGPAYLYLPRWQTIGQIAVYADGRRVLRSEGGPVWNGFNHPLWVELDPTGALPHEIVIRLDHLRGAGAGLSTVWIGAQDDLLWRARTREWLQAKVPEVASTAFLLLGFFSLMVWLRRRKEAIYGMFFACAAFLYMRCLHYYVGLSPLAVPDAWFGWMTVNSLGWLIIVTYVFVFRLHERRFPRLERAVLAVMALATLLTVPPLVESPVLAMLAPLSYLVLLALTVVLTVLACVVSWRNRSFEGVILSAWCTLNVPFGVYDWLLQNYRINIENIYLLPYTAIGTAMLFMIIVYRRYVGAIETVARVNQSLEERLQAREQALAESYQRLREAERTEILHQERQRLIADMHDGMGSALVSALAVVEKGRAEPDEIAQILRECLDDLKLTIDSLDFERGDLLLLLATLRYRLAPRLQQAGIALQWDADPVPELDWLTPSHALQVLRVLQEAFANIIKHAGASTVRVSIGVREQGCAILIEDNGQGFDVGRSLAAGRGLGHIRHRTGRLGGRSEWIACAQGTRFELWLPFENGSDREIRGNAAASQT